MIFIFIIFLTSCSDGKHSRPLHSPTASLTKTELENLQSFFNFLLFENYGAFVLFGTKPLCMLSIRDPTSEISEDAFQQRFSALPEEEKAKIIAIRQNARPYSQEEMEQDRDCYLGWLTFEKIIHSSSTSNYIFRKIPCESPDSYTVVFINVQQTALLLAEHYEIFKQAAGIDFDPLQVVFEAQDPDSPFWNAVFSLNNHLAKGLLFGFGLKNSLFGHWAFACVSNDRYASYCSENYRGQIVEYLKNGTTFFMQSTQTLPRKKVCASHFTIPLFGTVKGDDTVKKYKREKAQIKAIYQNKDVLEVTLQQLLGLS